MTRLLNGLSLALVATAAFMGCTTTACNRPEKTEQTTVSQRLAQQDKAGEPNLSTTQVLALAATAGQEQVFTAVAPGTGTRLGLDRDGDTFLNASDNCAGIANDQTDTDTDGLGDPCDPTPVPEPALIIALIAALPVLVWFSVRRGA